MAEVDGSFTGGYVGTLKDLHDQVVVSGTVNGARHLILTKGDGSTIDSGEVKPNSPVSATIDANGILKFTMVDGSVVTIGQVAVPVGTIHEFGGTVAPTGYLMCNGQAVSRTGTYANLFAAIGTNYGAGDGSTTFNVPDGRVRQPLGAGTNAAIGSNEGVAEAGRFARMSSSHNHPINISGDGQHNHLVPAHHHTFEVTSAYSTTTTGSGQRVVHAGNASSGSGNTDDYPAISTGDGGYHGHAASSDNTSIPSAPFFTVNYIIKV